MTLTQYEPYLCHVLTFNFPAQDIWKMPTGLVDRGEDVPNAVEREVLEETGLNVKFDRVLIVRQSHGLLFGRSDVFFVCACK